MEINCDFLLHLTLFGFGFGALSEPIRYICSQEKEKESKKWDKKKNRNTKKNSAHFHCGALFCEMQRFHFRKKLYVSFFFTNKISFINHL